jgi:hypothetical protein
MVIGDIPPLSSAFGLPGPRGPFCMPLSTSSKPIVISCRVPAPVAKITAGHDGYKARETVARSRCGGHRRQKSAI